MSHDWAVIFASILLILATAFFVISEYAVVTSRKSRVEAMARKGSASAKVLLKALDNLSPYIAGGQMAISMLGILVGTITEPYISGLMERGLGGWIPEAIARVISIVVVTFVLVVIGELCPKYLVLKNPERYALAVIRPLNLFVLLLMPLSWLAQKTSALLLKPFGGVEEKAGDSFAKDELLLLLRSGGVEGVLDKMHADLITRALKLDNLDADDIMVHRLDVKWLDLEGNADEVLKKLIAIPYTRIPVCKGDIDEVVGVVYLHDIVKHLRDPDFRLEKIVRSPIFIPKNLSMGKAIEQMRSNKTQILIVVDEYGGTSGIITLEDVVEEVFGELEDRLESERAPIEIDPTGRRVSAKASVRFDEIVSKLDLHLDLDPQTDTLAEILVNDLGRVPRPGDQTHTALGVLRVENMARRRITRVSLQLDPKWILTQEAESS